MTISGNRFLTVKQLCERWAVSRGFLRNMYSGRRPKLASYKFGKARRFRLDDVERVEAMRRRGPSAPESGAA